MTTVHNNAVGFEPPHPTDAQISLLLVMVCLCCCVFGTASFGAAGWALQAAVTAAIARFNSNTFPRGLQVSLCFGLASPVHLVAHENTCRVPVPLVVCRTPRCSTTARCVCWIRCASLLACRLQCYVPCATYNVQCATCCVGISASCKPGILP
jgi:hypothetical protein